MSAAALVLAAHGSDVEPSVNAQIRECAAAVGPRGGFAEVTVAFHRGDPPFRSVLDQLRSYEVVVVPLMTSAGYYSEVVLPRGLKRNATYLTKRVHLAPPVGTDPGIAPLVSDRVRSRMQLHGLDKRETTLALVGHGTPRHRRSRNSTFELAEKLAADDLCAAVRVAFLDDDPPIESLLLDLETQSLVVEPFLISDGPHTTQDIPRRLGGGGRIQNGEFRIRNLKPTGGSSGGPAAMVRVVLDSAVGTDPRMMDLILELAERTIQQPLELRS